MTFGMNYVESVWDRNQGERIIIFGMKIRLVIIGVLATVFIVVGLVAFAWIKRPKLIEVHPPNGAMNIPVTSQVRMEFSRPMDFETVVSHLRFEPAVDGSFNWEKNTLNFFPDTSWPGGQEINLSLDAGARATSWLTFPLQNQSWSFTTSEAYLAYLWPSDSPADIYVLNPLAGGIYQYTYGMGVLEFSASSDGMSIYFSASNALGGADLYMLDRKELTNSTDNSYKPKKLLDCGSAQCRVPAVSFDGMYLAYEHLIPDAKGLLGPALIRLVGLPDLNSVAVGQADHETVQPAWSSTGWLAYYDRTNLSYEVVDPQTNSVGQLDNQTGQPGSWSPDGKFYMAPEIYYYQATENSETGTSHLLRYYIPDGTWIDLSVADDVEDVAGNYSPGGESIAFARRYLHEGNWSFGRQLWIMNADGSNPHPITDESYYNHYDLSWSRDGHMLAYVRFNEAQPSDPPELWMINADGSNPLQLVIGGYSPLWIP
jgi:hypothetical protein